MKCDECLPRIEEYVDGELDGRTMESVAAHLASCASCAQEFAEFERDAEIYASYRRNVEVMPAHWAIVRARIEQEKDVRPLPPATTLRQRLAALFGSERKFRPAFAAALLLIAVGITAGIIYLNLRPRDARLVAVPPKPDRTLPIGGAPASIVKNKNSASNGSANEAPVVANNGTGTTGEKKNDSVKANPRRSQNPVPLISQQPRVNSNVSRDAEMTAKNARDSAPPFAPDYVDMSAQNPAGSTFTLSARGLDFDSDIARHAEKAELLLRSFRNVRLAAHSRSLDVAYEKENARKLLYQNIALRRNASTRGDEPTAELLNKLEPLLLDIANLPDRARSRDVRSIEQRMEKKEIVATLQVRTLVAAN